MHRQAEVEDQHGNFITDGAQKKCANEEPATGHRTSAPGDAMEPMSTPSQRSTPPAASPAAQQRRASVVDIRAWRPQPPVGEES